MLYGLENTTLNKIKNVFNKFSKIDKVLIYGSRAMGNYKYNSDIDFAIVGDFSWDFIGKLLFELDSISAPYMFDVTDYKRISNADLKKHIDTYGKSFYEKT